MPLAAIGFSGVGGAAAIGAAGTVASAAYGPSANKAAVNAQTAAANSSPTSQRDPMSPTRTCWNPYTRDGRDASPPWRDFIDLSGDGERSNAALDTFLTLPATRTR